MLCLVGILSVLALILLYRTKRWPPLFTNRSLQIAVVLILGFATWLRIWGWDIFPLPESQFVEEAQTMTYINNTLHKGNLDAYFPLTSLIGESGARILGSSLDDVRRAFIFWSVLGIGFAFIAGKWCFADIRSTLWFVLVLASSEFLVGSSRIAMETFAPVTTVLMVMSAMALFFHAPGKSSAMVCGFANGFIFLEHFSFKLIAVLSFISIVIFLLRSPVNLSNSLNRWRSSSRILMLIVFTLSFASVVLPVLLIDTARPFSFLSEGLNRHNQGGTDILSKSDLMDLVNLRFKNVGDVLTYIFMRSDNSEILPFHRGIVDPVTGWAGLAGIIYCLLSCRRNPLKLYALLCVISVIFLSGILVATPSRYRLLPMVPFYILCIGFLMDALLIRIRGLPIKWGIWMIATLIVCGTNVVLFFGEDISDPDVRQSFRDENMMLAYTLADIQKEYPGQKIYLVSDRNYLGQDNDYCFAYNVSWVICCPPNNLPRMDKGVVVSHDQFISQAIQLQGLKDCRIIRPPEYQCVFLVAVIDPGNNISCKLDQSGITSTAL
jgi:hypothetical protein